MQVQHGCFCWWCFGALRSWVTCRNRCVFLLGRTHQIPFPWRFVVYVQELMSCKYNSHWPHPKIAQKLHLSVSPDQQPRSVVAPPSPSDAVWAFFVLNWAASKPGKKVPAWQCHCFAALKPHDFEGFSSGKEVMLCYILGRITNRNSTSLPSSVLSIVLWFMGSIHSSRAAELQRSFIKMKLSVRCQQSK